MDLVSPYLTRHTRLMFVLPRVYIYLRHQNNDRMYLLYSYIINVTLLSPHSSALRGSSNPTTPQPNTRTHPEQGRTNSHTPSLSSSSASILSQDTPSFNPNHEYKVQQTMFKHRHISTPTKRPTRDSSTPSSSKKPQSIDPDDDDPWGYGDSEDEMSV